MVLCFVASSLSHQRNTHTHTQSYYSVWCCLFSVDKHSFYLDVNHLPRFLTAVASSIPFPLFSFFHQVSSHLVSPSLFVCPVHCGCTHFLPSCVSSDMLQFKNSTASQIIHVCCEQFIFVRPYHIQLLSSYQIPLFRLHIQLSLRHYFIEPLLCFI